MAPTGRSCRSGMARSASMPTARWAISRRLCVIISCGSAGAMATKKSSPPKKWSPHSIYLRSGARMLLTGLADELKAVESWSAETTEQLVRNFAERNAIKLGSIAQPLRAALTGRITSLPIFDVLAVLGKAESLARLHDQVAPAV